MPEGDTIHRTARSLAAALVGADISAFEMPRATTAGPPPGTRIDAVEARGKHLLVTFSDGHVLHTHLMMTGSWHVYATGERWRHPRRGMRVRVAAAAHEAVCFDAPTVELLDVGAVARHPALRALGPDLCVAPVDLDDVVDRAGRLALATTPIGDVLLDQRIAAGIGNVYKSEVAFLHGLHPSTPSGDLEADTLRGLYADAARLLQANLDRPSRTTVPGARPGSLWVYGRRGSPCRRCGTPVAVQRAGRDARVTYWCPGCQPAGP